MIEGMRMVPRTSVIRTSCLMNRKQTATVMMLVTTMIQTKEKTRSKWLVNIAVEKGAEQNREHDIARHAERNGRNESDSQGGVVRGTGTEHAAHIAFAESLAVGRALDRVRVGNPLADRCPKPGHDAHEGAQGAAAHGNSPMPEGVLDAFPHAAELADGVLGNARPLDPEVKHFRNSEQPGGDRNQADPLP